jgi:glycosyltransferase involved in cell wall biosynthesis
MQYEPLVSIIVPSYVASPKQAELLDETLHTVAGQTCKDYEVLVVDDGSPLDVSSITARHASTITLRQANAGSAMARNTGIAASRGRYLVFLDADDHLLPPALEAGLRCFAEHPECGFVIGRREEMTYEGAPVPWSVAAMPRETQLYNSLLGFDWYVIPPSSAMFRRDAVESVGGFRDPWGADDLDFYLRVAKQYPGWCYEEPAVTRYRRYSASSSRDGERMLRSIRIVYERQRPVVQGDAVGEAAFRRGLDQLTEIFRDCLGENVEDRMRAGEWRRALRSARLLARESPRRLVTSTARGLRAAVSGRASKD